MLIYDAPPPYLDDNSLLVSPEYFIKSIRLKLLCLNYSILFRVRAVREGFSRFRRGREVTGGGGRL